MLSPASGTCLDLVDTSKNSTSSSPAAKLEESVQVLEKTGLPTMCMSTLKLNVCLELLLATHFSYNPANMAKNSNEDAVVWTAKAQPEPLERTLIPRAHSGVDTATSSLLFLAVLL